MASLNSYNGRLYCLGRFPAKDGSGEIKQGRITLKLDDTPRNRKTAEKMVAAIEKSLKNGSFCWDDWVSNKTGYTWSKAIDDLYTKRVTNGRTSESTWQVSYYGLLKQMPPLVTITTAELEKALQRYEREQYSYRHLYYMLKDIAMLGGIKFPQVGMPIRKPAQKKAEDVPSDEEIIEWVLAAREPYRWFFGMMATYGLRPHEVERCDQIEGDLVQVQDETKTGFRTVTPLKKEWVELFRLHDKQLRPESQREFHRPDELSQWLNKERLRLKIRYTSYSLRHAYAGRLWREAGAELDLYDAAETMGHSVREHIKTYRSHIDPNKIALRVQDAIRRNQGKQPAD